MSNLSPFCLVVWLAGIARVLHDIAVLSGDPVGYRHVGPRWGFSRTARPDITAIATNGTR